MTYSQLWSGLAERSDWQEYILPKRTPEQFAQEGWQQAQDISHYVTRYMTVVEHGVGVGRILRHIPCKRRIGLDVAPGYLRIAELHDIEPVLMDGITIDLETGISDFTFSLMVFQHCNKVTNVAQLEELRRITERDHIVLVQFPRDDIPYYDYPTISTYSQQEVRDLGFKAGFRRVTVSPWRLADYHDHGSENREWLLEGLA